MLRHGAQDIGAPAVTCPHPATRADQGRRDPLAQPARPAARREVPPAGAGGAFVVDFACVEARLVVEVDGPSHETIEGRAQDAWRDRCLRGMGWRVVRVPNALVIAGGDLALAPIRAALDEVKR